jgi:uncharacterized paraquat-inducible protein A
MKPTNSIYLGDHRLDPPDEEDLHQCHNCQRLNTSQDYRRNDGDCPKCQAPYKSNGSEED